MLLWPSPALLTDTLGFWRVWPRGQGQGKWEQEEKPADAQPSISAAALRILVCSLRFSSLPPGPLVGPCARTTPSISSPSQTVLTCQWGGKSEGVTLPIKIAEDGKTYHTRNINIILDNEKQMEETPVKGTWRGEHSVVAQFTLRSPRGAQHLGGGVIGRIGLESRGVKGPDEGTGGPRLSHPPHHEH